MSAVELLAKICDKRSKNLQHSVMFLWALEFKANDAVAIGREGLSWDLVNSSPLVKFQCRSHDVAISVESLLLVMGCAYEVKAGDSSRAVCP